jgi:6-pyruvoyltetrahydropterin/6-carboxytetrahydropterin synthase
LREFINKSRCKPFYGKTFYLHSLVFIMNKVAVFRKEHFNAAHRLHNSLMSDEENERVFGKCNNKNYHGHNYDLIVKVVGVPDKMTGYVIDMKILSDLINREVIDRFDHKNLNLDRGKYCNSNLQPA